MFPDEADVQLVKGALFDPFEYLMARRKDGLLKTDFKRDLGEVSDPIPCHGRVQKIGKRTEKMFKLIGQTVTVALNPVQRCSGHADTYGVKTATHPVAMKIGKPVFKAMAKDGPDFISSDCALAGHHIAQGMAQAGTPAKALQHPLMPASICRCNGVNPTMTTPRPITKDSLLTLEAYAKIRKRSKPDLIAHRRLRSVHLGEHITLQFEDEQTVRRQIQEMLHIEKIFDEAGILGEIEAYAPLVPDGSNWKATLLIEYPDPHERKRELGRLIGVQDRMFVEVEGHARIHAIADEDLDRENEVKTSAVHFVRFELDNASKQAVRAGAAVKLGCDHVNYPAHLNISPETLASLAGDLR